MVAFEAVNKTEYFYNTVMLKNKKVKLHPSKIN